MTSVLPSLVESTPESDHHRGDPDLEDLLVAYHEQTDDGARALVLDDIVRSTLPLADSLAQRYRGRGIDVDDLVQVARTALVAAVQRYRPGAGRGFAAFAVPTIRGELKRHFRDAGWAVRPPRGLQELRAEVVRAEEDLRTRLGREVSLTEVAMSIRRDVRDVTEARACSSAFSPSSLDAPTPSGTPAGDLLWAGGDDADAVELRVAVRAEMSRLTARERLILRLRFEDERTQSEIGEVVGVSQMQVSRVLSSVLQRLREGLDPVSAA